MSKAGRPRKGGRRFACGKRTPSQVTEDIMQTAVEARIRVFGLKPDKTYIVRDDKGEIVSDMTGEEIARTDIMGTPLGRLQHWRYISADQAIAGHDFAVTMREYLATAKLQKPSQGKAGFVPATPDNGDGPPVKGETKAKQYMDALAGVDRSDPFSAPTATSIVWRVCIEEKDCSGEREIGALRVGLNAIHRVLYGRKAA
jgi:hypothetical protein